MHDQTNYIIRAHKNLRVRSLKKITILQLCLHIFKLLFKDFKMVNLISISITIGEHRYITFV